VTPDRQPDGDGQNECRDGAPGKGATAAAVHDRLKGVGRLFPGWRVPVLLRCRRSFAGSFEVVGDGLIFVDREVAGVGSNESFIKDAAGELVEFFFFESAQHAGADFGGKRNIVEGDVALLALFAKAFSECHDAADSYGRALKARSNL